jgi:hypothetical protein
MQYNKEKTRVTVYLGMQVDSPTDWADVRQE